MTDANTMTVETAEARPGSVQRFVRLRLMPTNLREANDFVAAHHRHNGRTARNGGKWAVGCEQDGEMVGVAIVGNPLSATFMDGYTAEVLRVCTAPHAQKGACSMLYQACWRAWRAMGGRKLITYTLKSESGASLRGAGWRIVAQTAGTDKRGWSMKGKREWHSIYGQQKLRWEAA